MISVRVFIEAEDKDYLKLLKFQSTLVGVKQGRRLKQVLVSDTDQAPQSIAELVEKTKIERSYKHTEKEHTFSFYGVFDFDVKEQGLWYIHPVLKRIANNCAGIAGVEKACWHYRLFGVSDEWEAEVLERCARPTKRQILADF